MLYERWKGVVAREPGAIALSDVTTGRSWTFKALAAEAERTPCPSDQVIFPCGISADFVVSVLTAWRHHRIVCPLEMDQNPPLLSRRV